jgi:flagellar FliJ protein
LCTLLALGNAMARPFHFKLERILEYRRQLEGQAKLAMSIVRQQIAAQNQRVEALHKDLEACLLEMSRTKQMTQPELWLWTGWRKRLELDKSQAQAKLAELRQLAEKRRLELVAKARDRKLLEKLRAKQAEKHVQEEQRKDQKEFDETGTLRHGRTLY